MSDEIWKFGTNIFTDGLLSFVIHAAVTLLIAWAVNRLIQRGLRQTADRGHVDRLPLRYLGRIVKVIIYALAVFSILSGIRALSGIGTAALGATSVASVIIGLAAQESFGNFIAGFFLAMEQPFKVGDHVTLSEKGMSGTVETMTFRHTVLRTPNHTQLIVPNSVMNTAIIEDRTAGEPYTLMMSFDIGYDSDVGLARKLIWQAALKARGYVDERTSQEKKEHKDPFVIRVEEFDASGIRLKFPLRTESYEASFQCASDVREALLKLFAENHIEIPYDKIEVVK